MSKKLTCLLLLLTSYFLLTSFPAMAQTKSPPVLSIASPVEDTTILGNQLTVSFIVGNFTFVDFSQKKTISPNEGHLHLWLDQPQPTLENANEVLSHDSVVFRNLPPGKHTLIAEIVNNDHSSLKPKVNAKISFFTSLPASTPLPTSVKTSFFTGISQTLTREQVFALDGFFFLIIGLILFLLFGKKRFFKK